jgi:hypothetical protein
MKKIILSVLLCLSFTAFSVELHRLVKTGTVDQVKEYVDNHPENVNHQDRWKRTPLFEARNVEVARLLIDRGAKIDHEDILKETPLFHACSRGKLDVVRLLLDRGAKIDHEDILKRTPLFHACSRRKLDVVRLLLDHGANVNQVDHHGITPLFEAAKNLHLECVHLLLNSGANIPFTVDQSEAVRSINYIEIIQLLEDKNILTASSEVVAEFDGLMMKKQLKPCLRQYGNSCMIHALKNVRLLTKYYKAEVEEREEIDKKFTSQRVYDECFQSDAFASLRAIITGQDFTTLAGGRAGEIGTAVFKISRTIDPKIQVVFDPKNFSLRQRDQSRKSEVVLVLSNKVHWHAIGLEEQPNGAVEISVLDSFFNYFCLEENFYRKLTLWFKGGSIEQPATEQLISRLYRKLTHWFRSGSIEQPATEQLRSRL